MTKDTTRLDCLDTAQMITNGYFILLPQTSDWLTVVSSLTLLVLKRYCSLLVQLGGNDGARNAHIALNGVNVLLFAWQLPTGFEIAQKVWGLDIAWF